jgi:hypothetical protein
MDIPSQFEDRILQMPESSYGVTRVIVTLEDGTELGDVFVAWGKEIVKVGSSETIPFDPNKIVNVRHQ